jgi:DNA mismatch repair protein MutS
LNLKKKSIFRRVSTRHSAVAPSIQPNAMKRMLANGSTLEIDLHTQKDLEVFESKDASKSLFSLCDSTRTLGGAQVLRQRMEEPFADRTSITRTQQSIAYINKNRDVFENLGLWLTGRVEQYQSDPLISVNQRDAFGFATGALALRMFEHYHYIRIFKGVKNTCMLVHTIREFLSRIELEPPQGDLAIIIEQIESIVSSAEFSVLPKKEFRGGFFPKVVRIDQAFRVYGKDKVIALLKAVYEIDALVAMADATRELGYTIPDVLEGPTRFSGTGLFHPQLNNPVPNDVALDQTSRLLFLTGPNMAGKTTYLRAVAAALYFGHLGMGVPATTFAFTPVDRLISSISISDDVHTGTSYFFAEVLRIKALAHTLAKAQRVVAIMDEPFKGTNVSEAFEASLAVMQRLELVSNSLFLFSSHLIELEESFAGSNNILMCHFEAKEVKGKLQFDYLLHAGVSRQRMGMRVLREEGVFELLDKVISSTGE